MKKYSFNSVDYRKKRYAFSSYQHPRTTHTYFFEATLQRIYIAQNKRYSFLSTKQHKWYHFESKGARNATYHFEAMLKRLITGNHKQYHFIGKKPHKQYFFDACFSKKRKQYHFESTFNAVFEASVIRTDIISSREIIQAQVIECETPERQCGVIDAQVIRSSNFTTVDDVLSTENAQQEHARVEDLVFGAARLMQCTFDIRDNTYEAIRVKITRYNVPSNVYKAEMLRSEFIAQLDDIYNAQKNTTNDFYSMIEDAKMAHAPYTFDTYKFSTTHSAFNNRENDAYSLIDSTYLAAFNSSNDKYKQKEPVRVGELAYTDSYDTANAGNAVILLVSEKAMQDTYTITEINDTKMDHLNASYIQKESVYETIVQRYDNVFEMAENASLQIVERFKTRIYVHSVGKQQMERFKAKDMLLETRKIVMHKFSEDVKKVAQFADVTERSTIGRRSLITCDDQHYIENVKQLEITLESAETALAYSSEKAINETNTQGIAPLYYSGVYNASSQDTGNTNGNVVLGVENNELTNRDVQDVIHNSSKISLESLVMSSITLPGEQAEIDKVGILEIHETNQDAETICITPIHEVDKDSELISITPIVEVNSDTESIEVTPVLETDFTNDKFDITLLLNVETDHENIKVTPVLNSITDSETICITPVISTSLSTEVFKYVGTFNTNIVFVDQFGTPVKKGKKPMWLHQNRPHWAARYFTQVRR